MSNLNSIELLKIINYVDIDILKTVELKHIQFILSDDRIQSFDGDIGHVCDAFSCSNCIFLRRGSSYTCRFACVLGSDRSPEKYDSFLRLLKSLRIFCGMIRGEEI